MPEPGQGPRCPVLVGVHQILQRVDDPLAGKEPLELMLDAVQGAAQDAGSKALLERADVVCAIRGRWPYSDPARVLAERIGAAGAKSAGTPWGGNVVQSVLNRFAREIAQGERDVVVLAGAENGRSLSRARKRGAKLACSDAPGEPDLSTGPELQMVHEAEIARRVFHPLTMYPIFENALRYARAETIPAHRARIARLWAGFSAVAAENPNAWIREPMTAEQIATPSPSNRMLGFPYTLLMNSNDKVDMSAALVLCSVETAQRFGVPRDRFVFVHAGTDAHDTLFVSNRADLHSSPAIRIAGRRALELADTSPDAISHVDLYSCFPSAVQVAANELGLSHERRLTVTGGLTFGGGPLNDYVLHGVARMAEVLRSDPGSSGLCSANGGFLTKHAFGVYSTEPPRSGFRYESCQAAVDALPRRAVVLEHDGDALLESYTVMFGADGPDAAQPTIAHAAFRLPDGRRTWANSEDRDLALEMTREEFCGRSARIEGRGTFRVA